MVPKRKEALQTVWAQPPPLTMIIPAWTLRADHSQATTISSGAHITPLISYLPALTFSNFRAAPELRAEGGCQQVCKTSPRPDGVQQKAAPPRASMNKTGWMQRSEPRRADVPPGQIHTQGPRAAIAAGNTAGPREALWKAEGLAASLWP